MGKKVIIIGAGVSGMATASLLQAKGFETEIFESHKKPGGLMTYWKRNDFIVENCIHWLVGSNRNSGYYKQWKKVLDIDQLNFHHYDVYARFEDTEGQTITFFTDIDRLETELLDKAPEDETEILRFTAAVRKMIRFRIPAEYGDPGLRSAFCFLINNFSLLGEYNKWSAVSERTFAQNLKNNLLRKAFEKLFAPEMSMIFIIMTLAWMHNRQAGYPVGGSLRFSRLMEARVLESGGTIRYNSLVQKILVKNNTAVGIQLEDGTKHMADWVVSASDGMETLTEFLSPDFTEDYRMKNFRGLKRFPSYFLLSLGVKKVMNEWPSKLDFELKEPLFIDEKTTADSLNWRIFNYDNTLSPDGCTLITSFIPCENYDFWYGLKSSDPDTYKAEKDRILKAAKGLLLTKMGLSEDDVIMTDISTPSSVYRYTRNYKGSMEGWLLTAGMPARNLPNQIKGLKNFCMVGQWIAPGGGLPSGLNTALDALRVIR